MPHPTLAQRARSAFAGLILATVVGGGGARAADVIDFDLAPPEVGEGAGSVVLAVSRSGSGVGVVGVSFATVAGSAHAVGDYTAASGTLSWGNGDLADQYITVAITDDAVFELYESFTVALSSPTGGATLATSGTTIQIDDDDANPAGVLSIRTGDARHVITTVEDGGAAVVEVTRSGSAVGAVSATLSYSDVEALAGTDYTALGTALSWADGESGIKTIAVPVIDDSLAETAETFSCFLANPTGGVSIDPIAGSASVMIIDDDAPTAGTLSLPASLVVDEDVGTISLTVRRLGGSQGAVTVDYATQDNSAAAPGDYAAASGTLSWADGDASSRTIAITVADDGVAELDEAFFVAFQNPTGGLLAPAPLGAPYAYLGITVLDDDADAGAIRFAGDDQAVGEGAGSITLTVLRERGASGAVSVDYASSDSSATAPADYGAVSGTLTWGDGDASPKTITVPIAQDAIVEPQEVLAVDLANPGGGALLDASGFAGTMVRIDDDDPRLAGAIAMAAARVVLAEGVGTAHIAVSRIGGSFPAQWDPKLGIHVT